MKRQIFGWGVGFAATAAMASMLLVASIRSAPPSEAVARRDVSKVSDVELELILTKIREGDLKAIQKDMDGARRAWQDARRMGRGLWPIHEGLADSYARVQLHDDALREYAIALPLVPEKLGAVQAGLIAKRANVLAASGRPLDAIRAYLELNQPAQTGGRIVELALKADRAQAVQAVSDHAEVHDPRVFLMLSALLQRLDRKGEAAEALARFCVAVAPWDEKLNLQAIEGLVPAGKIDRAVELCRAWAKASPGSYWPYVHMGGILAKAGREKEAIVAYTSIVDVKPGDAAAHALLGGILRGLNRPDDAIGQYLAAKRARPEDQGPYGILVELYQAKGDAARAEEVLAEGVKRFGMTGEFRSRLVASTQERIATLKAAGKVDEVRALRKRLAELNVPEGGLFDLKIVMTWDAASDVDLDVFEPGGEHVEHGHAHSKSGGHYYVDNTQGRGPETYTLPTVAPGTYRIGAHLHGNTRSTVTFVVILYEDTSREERREETLILEAGSGVRHIRDVVISR